MTSLIRLIRDKLRDIPKNVPLDYSQISVDIYIGAWPLNYHREKIKSLNESPLRLLWLPTLDTLITPIPLASLWRGVEASLPVIAEGTAVLAHCRVGMHRSVAMASSVLIATEHLAGDAMSLIKAQREKADPYAPYIQARIVVYEEEWQRRSGDEVDRSAM